jgi:hypothetical protein
VDPSGALMIGAGVARRGAAVSVQRRRRARPRHDVFSPRRSGRQHAVHACERKTRRRENGRDPREQFEGRHDAVLGAARAGVLHAVRKAPIGKATEAIERHRGACPVTEETLGLQHKPLLAVKAGSVSGSVVVVARCTVEVRASEVGAGGAPRLVGYSP